MALTNYLDLPNEITPIDSDNLNNDNNYLNGLITDLNTNKLNKSAVKLIETASDNDTYGCNYLNSKIADINESINDVVKSGSNENGNWIKFSDGTMICIKTMKFNTSITAGWGNWYESTTGFNGGTFAQSFKETPRVFTQAITRAAWIESLNGTTKTNVGTGWICKPVAVATDEEYTFDIMAIGKWK